MPISRILFPDKKSGWQLFISPRHYCRGLAVYPKESRRTTLSEGKSYRNLLLDLAPSVVYPANNVTIVAVGSYPAFSPLSGNCQTVRFLWHFPCPIFNGTPGVTRHFVLRSSDFPLFKKILLK